ncbi:MAG: hypothetical protein JNL97_04365 [Verrucomicrobiales bacterium]|nr:hypothetical protein [Verrucomicrobiales bacterium]
MAIAMMAAATAGGIATLGRVEAAELGVVRDGGTVRLTLGGEDGAEYSVESLERLLNEGREWKSIATVAPKDGPVLLYDPTCTVRPQNFYRLRLLQGGVPVEMPNFRLLDGEGRAQELYYQSDAKAVVLVFAGEGLASLSEWAPELRSWNGLAGVRVWVVARATGMDRARLATEAEGLGLGGIPVLEDEGGAVTRASGVTHVPEVVVLNPNRWSVVYRGRVSDAVVSGADPGLQRLAGPALEAFLEGKKVVVRRTEAAGQALAFSSAERTYSGDVAPLLRRSCVPCHSPGNIAPFAMTNHAVIHDYAPLMKDEVLTRRMPPWHADRRPQAYHNDAMLGGEEVAMLVDWIDRGAPRGDGPDPLAENIPPAPAKWPLGEPDRVLKVEEQTIAANGTVDYRYLVMPNPFGRDVWLRAAVVSPGNARVVHHVLVFNASSLTDLLQIKAGLGGYFAAYVPGMDQGEYPAGTGKFLKQNAFLVFQMHYTATGQPETDRTEVGLYLASGTPERELRTAAAYELGFTIPPGRADYPAVAEFRMPRDGTVYEFSPHMHYRGRSFRFEAVYPDQRREVLLNVPFYRFDWQTLYRLAEPKRLPAGTRIVVSGTWDNSAKNPYNPDPGASVRFGEQSWEEMFIGYFNWSDAP